MFRIINKRIINPSEARRIVNKYYSTIEYIDKCPVPKIDTGCTFCEPNLPIQNLTKQINNSKSYPWKHLIYLSNNSEYKKWPAKLEFAIGNDGPEGNVIGDLSRFKRDLLDPYHPVLISQSYIENKVDHGKDLRFLLYPDFKEIRINDYFSIEDEKDRNEVLKNFIVKFLTPAGEIPDGEVNNLYNVKDYDKNLILTCGHYQRDIRCGKYAPLIIDEIKKTLEIENLQDSTDVGVISHIGGHVFAGNVIIFKNMSQGIGEGGEEGDVCRVFKSGVWYGRVKPENVQGIVSESIVNSRIIKEIYRGDVS
ncbi:unnamed protein product [[Candida] boidinii]|uniref:Altered inheritance of mitochondria protein 32 n=1 Tax=Candida boidinii TaxID=5477 RepID=A0A9W6WH23_CANBO|nr:hypothetical protein B5S30_g3764 [[Candida] boidinii]GME72232.1 unnamed protein product [[Candida] boidinii]GMF98175.1 unnamed protein product [[Candida] boidinii]